ncbi:L-ribulose-5-phosphate 4-epimerase, partial [bacterium]
MDTPQLTKLREEVAAANWALPKAGLVTMHSGNASGYDPEADLLFIKPSGMDYEAITPDNLVAVRVSTGEVVTQGSRPSVDLPHHLYLYRHLPEVRG